MEKKLKVTNTAQFEYLIQELEKTPSLAKGSSRGSNPSNKKKWEDISKKLNAFGPPARDCDGWQKVWRDLKFKVKKKVTNNNAECNATGGGRYKQLHLSPMEEAVANLMQLTPDGLVCGVQDQGFSLIEDEEESRATSACSLPSSNVECDEYLPTEGTFTHHQPGNNSASGQEWFMECIEDVENICAPESSNAINDRSKTPKKSQRNKNEKKNSRECLLELHTNMQEKLFNEISLTMISIKNTLQGRKKIEEQRLKLLERKNEREEELFQTAMKIKKIELQIKERELQLLTESHEIDVEELIRIVYSCPVLWDQSNKNYYNAVLIDENWQSVAVALKQPKELCKKKWQNTCEQFGNELKKIPISLSQEAELSKEQYDPYTAWPYFKSLLFLKNHLNSRTPAGYCSLAEDFPETSNEVNLNDSFSESDEDIPDIEEAVAQPVRRKPKVNSDCAAEVLANEQRKLELLKHEVSIQRKPRDEDNEFLDSLIPYIKTMDMRQKMLCRMELQRTVFNHSFPADTRMPEAPQNSTIQMDYFAEDSKMNIVDITAEPKYL